MWNILVCKDKGGGGLHKGGNPPGAYHESVPSLGCADCGALHWPQTTIFTTHGNIVAILCPLSSVKRVFQRLVQTMARVALGDRVSLERGGGGVGPPSTPLFQSHNSLFTLGQGTSSWSDMFSRRHVGISTPDHKSNRPL